jgi:hypothetical protein
LLSGLVEGCKHADIGVGVAFAFGSCAVVMEEGLDTLGEVGGSLTVDVDDERRVFAVAVVDDEREFVEFLGVSIVAEFLGKEVGETVE